MIGEEEEIQISASLIERLRDAKMVTVLTGAGVSAESGIPTFRGAGGVWEKYDFQKLATRRTPRTSLSRRWRSTILRSGS
jgi:NAD-dependent deacetylase